MQKIMIIGWLLSCIFLSACSVIHPYQPDVQQGNILSLAHIQQIKLGMSKEQVVTILGNPILANIFNNNHWAYVYTFQHSGGMITKKRLDIYFRGGRVSHVEDQYPSV